MFNFQTFTYLPLHFSSFFPLLASSSSSTPFFFYHCIHSLCYFSPLGELWIKLKDPISMRQEFCKRSTFQNNRIEMRSTKRLEANCGVLDVWSWVWNWEEQKGAPFLRVSLSRSALGILGVGSSSSYTAEFIPWNRQGIIYPGERLTQNGN